ncbi:uncharacterized protein LOC132886657 isoform X2 [Neoarius graeffei]|nr:uncharacterized protein LOC132886657 isoform X2 [Neoarius graeffei]XP_060777573.1 uncharacterized protein LOC132886657 isoform X2 [Neoarius graeffei]XP_060777574.1 uncharacterized protein LOC132886657 isoform X2 [Neoarius graeffei]
MCTALNIPLSKTDHPLVRLFLSEKVINGGSIPRSHQLQEKYLGDLYAKEKSELKKRVSGKHVAVIFDETPDVEGRCVLNILLAPLEKDPSGRIISYLANTIFLDVCNHSTVSMSVVKTLQEFDIANENVIVFDTDNAAYMLKAYREALKSLFPQSIHITCTAHIMNLIGGAFRKPFTELNAFMMHFSQMFYMAGGRKRRYLSHLAAKMEGSKATMAPNPCATRWNSWFCAAEYHARHFSFYREFLQSEMQVCGRSAPMSVEKLHEVFEDPVQVQCRQIQLRIISDKCKVMLQLLDVFQSRTPVTTKVFNYLEDLQMNLAANKALHEDVCAEYFSQFPLTGVQKSEILRQVEEAFGAAEEKVTKYMSNGQPGIEFLKQVRVFQPKCIPFMPTCPKSYNAIPGFDSVPSEELSNYLNKFGPEALQVADSGTVDLDVFWLGLRERLPSMSQLALMYMNAVSNSADAERSNSIYKLVLSNRRRSTSCSNLKALVFLYYNQKIQCGLFESEEPHDEIDM